MERLKMIISDILNEMGAKEFNKLVKSFKFKKLVYKTDKDILYDDRFVVLLNILCTRHYTKMSVVKANFKELVFERGFDVNNFGYSDGNILLHGIEAGCKYNLVILTNLFIMVIESYCEVNQIQPDEYLANMLDVDKMITRKKHLLGYLDYMLGMERFPFHIECENSYLITLSILMCMKTTDIKDILLDKYEEYLLESKIIKKPWIKGGHLNVK